MGEPDCQRREDDFLFDDRQTRYDRQEAVDQICLGWSGGEGQSRCQCRCLSVVLARWPLLLYVGGGSINFQSAIFITFACVQTCVGPSDTLTILVLSLVSPPLMSVRYAPLPNTQTDPLLNDEMEAAFEDEDDDDDDDQVESRPLNPATYSPPRTPTPGRYDFENFDYASFPPPGSPTCPSSSSLPSDIGNSNGFIPSPSDVRHASAPRPSWFRRSARAILPNSLISRLHLDYEPAHGIVGGGTDNDGVFANVTAKPSRPVLLRNGSSSVLPSFPVLIHRPHFPYT